jgi:hypothetical protein
MQDDISKYLGLEAPADEDEDASNREYEADDSGTPPILHQSGRSLNGFVAEFVKDAEGENAQAYQIDRFRRRYKPRRSTKPRASYRKPRTLFPSASFFPCPWFTALYMYSQVREMVGCCYTSQRYAYFFWHSKL